jgi:thioredoxin reductase
VWTHICCISVPHKAGQRFRRNPGLRCAGAAGIHFAHLLKEANYNHVVVLEADERVGGKSHTKAMDSYPTVRHEVRKRKLVKSGYRSGADY